MGRLFPLRLNLMSCVSKGLVKLGNIVAETLFLIMIPWVAKLAGNKESALPPQWQSEETLSAKTNEQ